MSRDDFAGQTAQEAQQLALDEDTWSRVGWTQTWLALYLIQRAEETLGQFLVWLGRVLGLIREEEDR
jgi:hypothetical protein